MSPKSQVVSWLLRAWAWSAVVWSAAFIFSLVQWRFIASSQNVPLRWDLIWNSGFSCLTEAFITPAVVWYGRQLQFTRQRLIGDLLKVALGAAVFLTFYPALRLIVAPWWNGATIQWPAFSFALFVHTAEGNAYGDLSDYILMIAVAQALRYQAEVRKAHERHMELTSRLASAELQNLKAQLRPHFLFNCLHTVSALMTTDPEGARSVLTRLSDLLRSSLAHIATEKVPLSRELEILNAYVEIERTRFAGRLSVEFEIDSNCLHAMVPNMFLQPLVENAIQHGIAKMSHGGLVKISASARDNSLAIEVFNEGPPAKSNASAHGLGVGLQNTRARLQSLYGDEAMFELLLLPDGGALATIRLPLHPAHAARGAVLASAEREHT